MDRYFVSYDGTGCGKAENGMPLFADLQKNAEIRCRFLHFPVLSCPNYDAAVLCEF